jgi:hypothetical protein
MRKALTDTSTYYQRCGIPKRQRARLLYSNRISFDIKLSILFNSLAKFYIGVFVLSEKEKEKEKTECT